MRNGYLNKSEEATLLKAAAILNKYCDWAMETGCVYGDEPPRKYRHRAFYIDRAHGEAATAAGRILEFLYDQDMEED